MEPLTTDGGVNKQVFPHDMRIWKEKADPKRHADFMSTSHVGGFPLEAQRDNLLESWVYFVTVEGFTFQFVKIEQIKEAKAYFSQKTHKSTITPGIHLEHYWQNWYERLPKGLTKNSKRQKILKALEQALSEFSS